MLRWFFALIVIFGAALGLLLGVLNADPVLLDLGLLRWEASLGAIVAAAVGLGMLIGLLAGAVLGRLGRRRRSPSVGTTLPTDE